jgi:hypothetical protein
VEESQDRSAGYVADPDGAEMQRILALGSAIGVPLVFATALAVVFAAGVRGPGAVLVAGWAAIVGGTFIGAAVVLAKPLGELGLPKHPVPHTADPAIQSAQKRSCTGTELHPVEREPASLGTSG